MAVERYYAVAAAGDGAAGCSLLTSIEARSAPENYGRPPGPSYLRGGKTCPAVLSLLFKHLHRQLAAGIRMTGVRVEHNRAVALFSLTGMPFAYTFLRREGGSWKLATLFASAMS
jgi:hypothetical protein